MKSKSLFYLILLTFFASIIPAVHAQTFSVIHSFTVADGVQPNAGVVIRGNSLYGLSNGYGGPGTAYELTRSGSNWVFSKTAVLSNLYGPNSVVFGPDGHLYGTAFSGGSYGGGAVFKLTPQVTPCMDAACYWRVSDTHDFGSGTDGAFSGNGDLIWDQKGNMYGTTTAGGTSGAGTVYQLTPSGTGYTETVVHSFSGPDGAVPYAGLILDKNGNLFGAASRGGANGYGVVFEATYIPGVGWTEQVLYNFQHARDGASPFGALLFDSAGNLYGTTGVGGSDGGGNGGGGTVFQLSPSGNTWTFKLLHSFSESSYLGPMRALTMDAAGNLYGATVYDGIYNQGSVFKLSKTENGWMYTSLHDFTGGIDGALPQSNVAIDTDGTLYGTTVYGGDNGYGVVWMIKP